jgi:glycosyltransferase 2 family protein
VLEPAVETEPRVEAVDADVFSRGLLRKLMLPLVLAVLVYGGMLLYADAGAIMQHAGGVSAQVLVTGALLASSNFVIRFVRWQYYLGHLRLRARVPTIDSALLFVSGFAMSITPGKLGEVIKSLLLKEAYSIPVARSAPIVLAERVTDLAALLVLGTIGLSALPNGALAAAASLSLVVMLFGVCAWRPLGNAVIGVVTRIPRVRRLRGKLQAAYDSLTTLMGPVPFAIGLSLAVVAWGLQCVSLNVIAWAFPGVTLSLRHGLLAYSAPLLAGALALIPGGLGVTEASMTGAIAALGGSEVTPSVAAAITILTRLLSLWLAIALGFAALALWRLRHPRA